MNGQQDASLDRRLEDLGVSVGGDVREQLQEMRELIARLFAAEHADWVKHRRADRLMSDRNNIAIIAVNFYASQFCLMTFRERVDWILSGRLPERIAEFTRDPEAAVLRLPDQSSDTV
jgi:predicted Zn-dependent peptidase